MLERLGITNQDIYNFGFKIIKIVLIIIFCMVLIKIGKVIVDKIVKRRELKAETIKDEISSKRIRLILNTLIKYTILFLGIIIIIEEMFGKVSVALAGVGGAAVGFGTQSLIKDVMNGIFILVEGQFLIGDHITIDKYNGIVESMELRVTKIRDFSGELHIIPNSTISCVTNHSRGNKRMLIDIDIAPEEDVDSAISLIAEVCVEFKESHDNVIDIPKVVGVVNIKESGITIRVVGMAKSGTQTLCENVLRKDIKVKLQEHGVELGYMRTRLMEDRRSGKRI